MHKLLTIFPFLSRVRGSIARRTRQAGTGAGAMWPPKRIGFSTSSSRRGGQVLSSQDLTILIGHFIPAM